MKDLLIRIAALTFILGLTTHSMAAPTPAPGAKPAAEAMPGEARTIPMYCRADAIDLAARTFTLKRRDGVEVKHVITPTTEIKQGPTAAGLQDIKAGDYVSGSRRKVSETQYIVIKITKFGPKTEKAESTPKPAPKTN